MSNTHTLKSADEKKEATRCLKSAEREYSHFNDNASKKRFEDTQSWNDSL